jgi:Domain of unknown function (DUF4430)
MHRKTLIVLLGAMTLAVAIAGSALAASSSPAVHVQIKSLTKTLRTVVVHGQSGWITKGGTPKGKCSANSAAGALNAATHGKWSGKYYKSVGGVFITSILGVTPKGSDYWSLYVNGKSASVGACAVKLHAGEKLLFKVVK